MLHTEQRILNDSGSKSILKKCPSLPLFSYIYLSIYLSICVSLYLYIYLFVYLSIYLSICVSLSPNYQWESVRKLEPISYNLPSGGALAIHHHHHHHHLSSSFQPKYITVYHSKKLCEILKLLFQISNL